MDYPILDDIVIYKLNGGTKIQARVVKAVCEDGTWLYSLQNGDKTFRIIREDNLTILRRA